jgi:hypothetical protein
VVQALIVVALYVNPMGLVVVQIMMIVMVGLVCLMGLVVVRQIVVHLVNSVYHQELALVQIMPIVGGV